MILLRDFGFPCMETQFLQWANHNTVCHRRELLSRLAADLWVCKRCNPQVTSVTSSGSHNTHLSLSHQMWGERLCYSLPPQHTSSLFSSFSLTPTVSGSFNQNILDVGVSCHTIPFIRGYSQPRDWTQISHTAGRFFTSWATKEAHKDINESSDQQQDERGRRGNAFQVSSILKKGEWILTSDRMRLKMFSLRFICPLVWVWESVFMIFRLLDFPGGSVSKESSCNVVDCLQYRRPRLDPWVKKIPCWWKWQPTAVFLPGRSHGQRSLQDCSSWDHKELDLS